MPYLSLIALVLLVTEPLGPGDHFRKLDVDGRDRSYFVHIPPGYDPSEPNTSDDSCTVEKKTYGPGKDGAEVILYTIRGGGHTWPGRRWPVPWLGATTRDISANDLMWEFFERHPMK